MDVTWVKAACSAERDRTYLEVEGVARRVPVHVAHDLPHLVVESFFRIDDGLWSELTDGRHAAAERAATARDPAVNQHGRIASGAAEGSPTSRWLTEGHKRAKTLTNAVANRFADGPDTPVLVRARVARSGDEPARAFLDRLDDAAIEEAMWGVKELLRCWAALAPGGALRLTWPLRTATPHSDEPDRPARRRDHDADIGSGELDRTHGRWEDAGVEQPATGAEQQRVDHHSEAVDQPVAQQRQELAASPDLQLVTSAL